MVCVRVYVSVYRPNCIMPLEDTQKQYFWLIGSDGDDDDDDDGDDGDDDDDDDDDDDTRWFKYDRDWFVCKQAALRSSCATLREWSHNLHPHSCSG